MIDGQTELPYQYCMSAHWCAIKINILASLKSNNLTATFLDGHWEMTPSQMHRSCNDTLCPTQCSQLDLNPANLAATIEAKWFPILLLLRKRHVSMMSQLRHYYVLSCKYWWDFFYIFSITRNVRMIHAKNCEKLPKFVKVMAKILLVPFFQTWCIYQVAHKNVTNFAMALYCSTIKFKQREITYLKSNHSWKV